MIGGTNKSRVPSLSFHGPITWGAFLRTLVRLTADARRSTISQYFVVAQTINNDVTRTTELVATVRGGTNHLRVLDRMDCIDI